MIMLREVQILLNEQIEILLLELTAYDWIDMKLNRKQLVKNSVNGYDLIFRGRFRINTNQQKTKSIYRTRMASCGQVCDRQRNQRLTASTADKHYQSLSSALQIEEDPTVLDWCTDNTQERPKVNIGEQTHDKNLLQEHVKQFHHQDKKRREEKTYHKMKIKTLKSRHKLEYKHLPRQEQLNIKQEVNSVNSNDNVIKIYESILNKKVINPDPLLKKQSAGATMTHKNENSLNFNDLEKFDNLDKFEMDNKDDPQEKEIKLNFYQRILASFKDLARKFKSK
ncbi:unnamed protein product [Didymodactylos carnosus]|uniref:Uncharacterized protein n=1 Tax=Didymodactylos carnosus TaxID=1234261 RepID=A0A813VCC9_9BILA|nr:unnamed protein product [Didymodactylos carnosus]CAF3625482.1 unnamed protein product [Didymodactylos carnosus]